MTPRPAARKVGRRETAGTSEALDVDGLMRALEAIAAHEAHLTERFYEIFFERRPDTRELFGVHAIAEREEMMHETLGSLQALGNREPWLEGNLVALGESHGEYGVTEDMYTSFVDALIECAREILGGVFDEAAERALRDATEEISSMMSEAGRPTGT